MIFAPILLAAALDPQRVVLTDEVYPVPAGESRYVEFVVSQQPAAVRCDLDLVSGPAGVRAELLDQRNLALFQEGKPHLTLSSTAVSTQSLIIQGFQAPGKYALAIIDAPGRPAQVHLHLVMDFSGAGQAVVAQYLSPRRRIVVLLISFLGFFAIVTFSARKLLRAIKA